MPRQHAKRIRKHKKTVAQRAQDLPSIASWKIGSSDGSGEQGVAGEQQMLFREEQADAALGVSWGVNHFPLQCRKADGDTVVRTGVWLCNRGCGDTQPAGLDLHRTQQTQIPLVEQHRRPGQLLE
jgi:hypothetical protein